MSNNGYYYVALYNTNNTRYGKNLRVHRLVAEAYLPNPDCLPQVDHIDEDKENNNVSNLQWIDNQSNKERSSSKYYFVEHIESGHKEWVFNLSKWCKERGLSFSNLYNTYKRKLDPTNTKLGHQCKGYRVLDMKEIINSLKG